MNVLVGLGIQFFIILEGCLEVKISILISFSPFTHFKIGAWLSDDLILRSLILWAPLFSIHLCYVPLNYIPSQHFPSFQRAPQLPLTHPHLFLHRCCPRTFKQIFCCQRLSLHPFLARLLKSLSRTLPLFSSISRP